MHAFLEMMLSNSLVVIPIAVIARLCARRGVRPAWVHALWLVVLVKLITPPLVRVPVAVEWGDPQSWSTSTSELSESDRDLARRALQSAASEGDLGIDDPEDRAWAESLLADLEAEIAAETNEFARAPALGPNLEMPAFEGTTEISLGPASGAAVQPVSFDLPPSEVAALASALIQEERNRQQRPWSWWWAAAWGIGALAMALWSLRDILTFARRAKGLDPAPRELNDEVAILAASVGLPTSPEVRVTDRVVSPMVWAPTLRPTLILPSALLARLSPAERETLILHELAHVRRRDHWVRFLELTVRIVHWCNPLAWWAIHELRAAEEECCDLWVTSVSPDAHKPYAQALLTAAEFLTQPNQTWPATSTGFGAVPEMRRRLRMIFQRQTERSLGFRGQLAVLLTAFLTVPLLPGWAQDAVETAPEPPAPPAPLEVPVADAATVDTPAPFPGLDRPKRRAPGATGPRRPRAVDAAAARPGVTAPDFPDAPTPPRAPTAPAPGQYGRADDAPSPREVARAVELAVALLLENNHAKEAKLLIDLANSAASAPSSGAAPWPSGRGQAGAYSGSGRSPGVAQAGPSVSGARGRNVSGAQNSNPFSNRARTVRVRPGDSLVGLAEKHYGDSNLWVWIARANELEEGASIRVGDRLVLPPLPGETNRSNRSNRRLPRATGVSGFDAPEAEPSPGAIGPWSSPNDRIKSLENQLERLEQTLEKLMYELKEAKESEPRSHRRLRTTRGGGASSRPST